MIVVLLGLEEGEEGWEDGVEVAVQGVEGRRGGGAAVHEEEEGVALGGPVPGVFDQREELREELCVWV